MKKATQSSNTGQLSRWDAFCRDAGVQLFEPEQHCCARASFARKSTFADFWCVKSQKTRDSNAIKNSTALCTVELFLNGLALTQSSGFCDRNRFILHL
jgi:hypothetical protein